MRPLYDYHALCVIWRQNGRTPLIQATIFGNIAAMEEFVRCDVNIDASDMVRMVVWVIMSSCCDVISEIPAKEVNKTMK